MATIALITPLGVTAAKFLAQSYAAVSAQTIPAGWDWQWVICVDGTASQIPAPDRANLADLQADPRVAVVELGQRGGPGMCRNVAAGVASTAAILRNLDGDDILLPGALAADIAAISSGFVWTTSEASDLMSDGTRISYGSTTADRIVDRGTLLGELIHTDGLSVHPATVAVRRDIFWRYGGYKAFPRGEDTGFLAEMNVDFEGLHRVTPSLLYRKWDGQITAAEPDRGTMAVRASFVAALAEAAHR